MVSCQSKEIWRCTEVGFDFVALWNDTLRDLPVAIISEPECMCLHSDASRIACRMNNRSSGEGEYVDWTRTRDIESQRVSERQPRAGDIRVDMSKIGHIDRMKIRDIKRSDVEPKREDVGRTKYRKDFKDINDCGAQTRDVNRSDIECQHVKGCRSTGDIDKSEI